MNKNIKNMPMLVLRGVVVFPGMLLHFDVGREKSIKAIDKAMDEDRIIYLVTQRDMTVDQPDFSDVYPVGCVAVIKQVLRMPGGDSVRVLAEGKYRALVETEIFDDPYFCVKPVSCTEKSSRIGDAKKEAMLRYTREVFENYSDITSRVAPDVAMRVLSEDDPGVLSDYLASNLPIPYESKQIILSELNPVKRLDKFIHILTHEFEIQKINYEINEEVKSRIDDNQREYYIREQLKVLSEELGEGDGQESEISEYKTAIDNIAASDEIKEKLYKEVDRLSKMPQGAHEATVVRNYLDACLKLPWNIYTKDKIDIAKAEKMLDKEHYGMKDIKQRIIELLAVKKIAPDINGQIICFSGPPGVGKTSIASSIAKCMGRKFARISLGGIKDEAEIRGHRKTYIGAMEGRIMSAIADCGSSNPLILLDEVDKIGSDFKGDSSAALLEVLDPEQNVAFRDHYIDLPYDLSKVLFVTTANDESAIPGPLLDRMEVIRLSSYTAEDKFNIAKHHLINKQLQKHGLKKQNIRFTDDAIRMIIEGYTKEAGVRELDKKIAAVCRKAAVRIASGENGSIRVTSGNIHDFLGTRKFRIEDVNKAEDETGVVNGLAWTSVGGEILRMEAIVLSGTGKIVLTGSLGDVMKESAQTAVSYVRSKAHEFGIDPDFYKTMDIHIHATEAAVPKDGPSAGVSMATAIVSALTGTPIRHDVAMTGEITLHGKVTAIGGLKEKTMAAYRAGIKTVIIPEENQPDLNDIDERVRKNINFITASHIERVLSKALVRAPAAVKDKPIVNSSAIKIEIIDNKQPSVIRQ